MIPLRLWAALAVVVCLALLGWYTHSLRAEIATLADENATLRATIATDQESARASAQAAESRYQAALAKARRAAPRAAQRVKDAQEVLAYVPPSNEPCAATAAVLDRIRSRIAAGVRDDASAADPGAPAVPDGGRRADAASDGR